MSKVVAVSKEAGALYNQYLALHPHSRADFLKILKGSGAIKKEVPDATQHYPALLYARITEKVYSYRGVSLPPLASLSKTSAVAELEAALNWLKGEGATDHATVVGLIDIAADAVARELPWTGKEDSTQQGIAKRLSQVPATVDRAYPGYKMNGVLTTIAQAIGGGVMKLVKEKT